MIVTGLDSANALFGDAAAPDGSLVRENFARWFQRSTVIDTEGAPLPVYHGTGYAFEAFDPKTLGRSVTNPTTAFGFFFTDDVEDAASWAEKSLRRIPQSRQQIVLRCYLSLQNPKILTEDAFQYYLRRARAGTIAKHLAEWKAQGFDGMQTLRSGARWFTAFEPHQVKSTRNSGLFTLGAASLHDGAPSPQAVAAHRAVTAKALVASLEKSALSRGVTLAMVK